MSLFNAVPAIAVSDTKKNPKHKKFYFFWSKSSKTQRNKNAHARVPIRQIVFFYFFFHYYFFFFYYYVFFF